MTEDIKKLVRQWATPSIVITLITTIIYGIIWGVQLNEVAITHAQTLGILNKEVKDLRREQVSSAVLNARTAAVLEALAKQVDALESRMTRNESWITDNREHRNSDHQ